MGLFNPSYGLPHPGDPWLALSHQGNAQAAEAALEEALIQCFGYLVPLKSSLKLRSDNGLVFSSKPTHKQFAAMVLSKNLSNLIRHNKMVWLSG